MTRTEPRLAVVASWVSILCSFVLSATTWVKLAELAGFSSRTSWAMVGVVDAYVISALVLWTFSPNKELAAFARKNTYAAALIGVAAQSGYHAWTAYGSAVIVVVLALVIGAIPPGFAALGIHMRAIGLTAAAGTDMAAKFAAGRLELTLLHDAADAFMAARATQAELAAKLAELELALAAATVTPEPERADTDIHLGTVEDLAAKLDIPPARLAHIVDSAAVTDTTKPRRAVTGVKAAALAWLTDNAGDTSAQVLAEKLAATFGCSVRTGHRYVADFRAA